MIPITSRTFYFTCAIIHTNIKCDINVSLTNSRQCKNKTTRSKIYTILGVTVDGTMVECPWNLQEHVLGFLSSGRLHRTILCTTLFHCYVICMNDGMLNICVMNLHQHKGDFVVQLLDLFDTIMVTSMMVNYC